VVAGFSMGGASAWHLAVHHSGLWCAASPGAGFAETAQFAKIFATGKEPPPEWEQKLWRWYDATDYAGNLFNCPTIAYSGEIDGQKQSADIMEQVMAAEGLKLERLIGPQTGHKYHPDTLKELKTRLDGVTDKGRDPIPKEVHLTTYTLQYPRAAWVEIEGLEHHWERADVRAHLEPGGVLVTTTNVTALKLELSGLDWVAIDDWKIRFRKPTDTKDIVFMKKLQRLPEAQGRWAMGTINSRELNTPLRKQPGSTGPIEDAFMTSFLFVRPTGKPLNGKVGAWAKAELDHATKMWRDIFRGDAPVKDDSEVSSNDINSKNLILWGDPSSNRLLGRMLNPLGFVSAPNPLNPKHYVVINSGIDFRNDAYNSNALQTPKLPDWAIIDLDTPPGPRWPGKVAAAGFFDEQWR